MQKEGEMEIKKLSILTIVLGSIFVLIIILFVNNSNKELCIVSTPSSCKYFCPDLNKSINDFNVNIDRLILYVRDYECKVENCDYSIKIYEIKNCDIDYEIIKEFIVHEGKIKIED